MEGFSFRAVGMTRKENLQKQFVTIFLSDIPTNPYSSLYIKRIRLATALRSLRTTKLITVNLMINSHEIMISTQLPSPKQICYSANQEIGYYQIRSHAALRPPLAGIRR